MKRPGFVLVGLLAVPALAGFFVPSLAAEGLVVAGGSVLMAAGALLFALAGLTDEIAIGERRFQWGHIVAAGCGLIGVALPLWSSSLLGSDLPVAASALVFGLVLVWGLLLLRYGWQFAHDPEQVNYGQYLAKRSASP